MKNSVFNLDKMYLDCVDDEGNCFIVYWAKLKIWFFRLSYSGIIFSDGLDKNFENSSLRKSNRPEPGARIFVQNPILKVTGEWETIDPGYSETLIKDEEGNQVFWNCHHPKTKTWIEYKGKRYSGLGYVETLNMSIKPWNLPIDELRWGRFLSEKAAIVWINWRDKFPLNQLYFNGTLYKDAIFGAKEISFFGGKYRLEFQNPIIVREGKLSNILNKFSWIRILFPKKILSIMEIKYKSKSFLIKDSIKIEEGWSIFEIVKWGK